MNWFRETFAALSVRKFRFLWAGTWLSFMGFFMSTVVQSVVAFDLEGVNSAVGVVVFAQGIAMIALIPIGGALADRWPKRRVVAIGQCITAGIFLGLAYLVHIGEIRVAFLSLGSLVMGATFAFLGPARQALVVEVMPVAARGNAVALSLVANTGSRVVGPALAGLFLAWGAGDATFAYVAMACFYLSSASLLLFIGKSRVPPSSDKALGADVIEGFRYVAGNRQLAAILIFYTLIIMCGFPHVTLLPGLLSNELGRQTAEISSLLLVSAIGAVSASIGLARYADSPQGLRVVGAMGVLFGVALFGLANAPSFEWATGAMLLIGIGSGGFQTLGTAAVINASDPVMTGRVMSLTMLAFAGFGLTALPIGLMADWIGEPATLSGMAVLVVGLSLALSANLRRRE
jgi:MFS family permease